MTGREVEDRHLELLEAVKQAVQIPVAIRIGPFFSAMASMARGSSGGVQRCR